MDIQAENSCIPVKNSCMVELWLSSPKTDRISNIAEKVYSILNIEDPSDKISEDIINWCRLYCLKLSTKWDKVGRSRSKLEKRYMEWLQQDVPLPSRLLETLRERNSEPAHARGRPKKPFQELTTTKSKRMRVAELVASSTPAELQFAAESVAGLSSQRNSPGLTPTQALSLYLDLDLSQRKYNVLASVVNSINPGCFPSLYKLNKVKNDLLPINVYANESSAEVDLQTLLRVTSKSLLNVINLDQCPNELKLTCKWGFDGSSGHSQYKMKYHDSGVSDEFLFLVAMVPLKLYDIRTGRNVWVNQKPSSTLYCRPVKFMFKKETPEFVLHEENIMKEQISNLEISHFSYKGLDVAVSFEMLFTMVDGSVVNTLTDTNATTNCVICGATSSQMNTDKVLNRPASVVNYNFGLSTLHCWIRFFECLLHIGYKIPIKAWRVNGDTQKQVVAENKKRIQAEFKSKMGLIVDKPKPGYGSTNDGNTARRFFSNPDLSSEITGVDKKLIEKFSIILRVLASGHVIDTNRFRTLLAETRKLYLSMYSWYYMPSSVHKVLVHGCDIIDSFSLPIGQLSEDALEARHKEVRKNRLNHTRKRSRECSNLDLMRILLLNSDPLLSSQRKIMTKKFIDFTEEVKYYLIPEQKTTSLDNLNFDMANICTSEEESSSDSE